MAAPGNGGPKPIQSTLPQHATTTQCEMTVNEMFWDAIKNLGILYPRLQTKSRIGGASACQHQLSTRSVFLVFVLCLTVLVLGALLSSFLEEALYKCSI